MEGALLGVGGEGIAGHGFDLFLQGGSVYTGISVEGEWGRLI